MTTITSWIKQRNQALDIDLPEANNNSTVAANTAVSNVDL